MSTFDAGPAEPAELDDNPYDLLAEDHDAGHRWAFGTGFTDPLDGIDTSIPDGIDPGALVRFCLALGDDALIYSHRLQQWVARLPELEEETAVANIALDLLGQARLLLARAGGIVGQTEDQLAFFRAEKEFRNVRLAEHADRDFAELVVRLLMFSTWRLALFEVLAGSTESWGTVSSGTVSSGTVSAGTVSSGMGDPVLAAIAAKGVNELAYHRDYAASWVVRLGDGTPLSHAKAQAALDTLWPLLGELFRPDPDALAVAFGSAAAFSGPVPGCPVPGSAVPESAVPESSVPGSPVPGSRVPGNAASGSPVPGSAASGSAVPGSSVPGSAAPGSAASGSAASGGPVDRGAFDAVLDTVLAAARLDRPAAPPLAAVGGRAGRDGVHTEAMGYILAELQSVARAHPDATW